MTIEDHRMHTPRTADERTTLTTMLDFHRKTLEMKCEGLTPEQLKTRSVPASGLSLLGLVRHAAEVERGWFRNVLGGEDSRSPWNPPGATGRAGFDVDDADVEEAFAVWRAECRRAREIVAAADSLDTTARHEGETYSVRYVVAHMIEEYARHNGHADLLRESIDGVTGE
ncbi:DinB family protein [Streptomyces sp. NPDC057411]|uniref:DinB family protein n=1 Tax=unclassified Streptomyces TaxID=2593676 RepID=UPI0036447222